MRFSSVVMSAGILLPTLLALSSPAQGARPVFLVGCFNGQTYPPAFCENFTSAVSRIAEEAVSRELGEEVSVRVVSDWQLLLDELNMPNVVGAVISIKQGLFHLPELRQAELIDSFKRGLGLVGIHGVGYVPCFGNVSILVFPLGGNKVSAGRIHRNRYITSVHTHVKLVNTSITTGLPETLVIPDSGVVYRYPIPASGWWAPPEGNLTVLYMCTTANRSFPVPSIVTYQNSKGRSVTFAGLEHTDSTGRYSRDPGWFNHSLSLPEVRELLSRSISYVLEPYAQRDLLDSRVSQAEAFFDSKLKSLEEELDRAERAKRSRRAAALLETILISGVSAALCILIFYYGFLLHASAHQEERG